MEDMLVRLYDLPESKPLYDAIDSSGIIIRRPGSYEAHLVTEWVGATFSKKWASEVQVALSRQPVSCFIATQEKKLLGFACYGVTALGFFGPTGVTEQARGAGLGKALLFKCLEALRQQGHAYGIIGGVGPKEFYEKACFAKVIEGSNPGIYIDILPETENQG